MGGGGQTSLPAFAPFSYTKFHLKNLAFEFLNPFRFNNFLRDGHGYKFPKATHLFHLH